MTYSCCVAGSETSIEQWLNKTTYAKVLKELMGMSDTIGLLRRRMAKDERRLLEDSVLGKTVRIRHALNGAEELVLSDEEKDYLLYWVLLAKEESAPGLVYEKIADLERLIEIFDSCNEQNRG
jgi:hypothetical protein